MKTLIAVLFAGLAAQSSAFAAQPLTPNDLGKLLSNYELPHFCADDQGGFNISYWEGPFINQDRVWLRADISGSNAYLTFNFDFTGVAYGGQLYSPINEVSYEPGFATVRSVAYASSGQKLDRTEWSVALDLQNSRVLSIDLFLAAKTQGYGWKAGPGFFFCR